MNQIAWMATKEALEAQVTSLRKVITQKDRQQISMAVVFTSIFPVEEAKWYLPSTVINERGGAHSYLDIEVNLRQKQKARLFMAFTV